MHAMPPSICMTCANGKQRGSHASNDESARSVSVGRLTDSARGTKGVRSAKTPPRTDGRYVNLPLVHAKRWALAAILLMCVGAALVASRDGDRPVPAAHDTHTRLVVALCEDDVIDAPAHIAKVPILVSTHSIATIVTGYQHFPAALWAVVPIQHSRPLTALRI